MTAVTLIQVKDVLSSANSASDPASARDLLAEGLTPLFNQNSSGGGGGSSPVTKVTASSPLAATPSTGLGDVNLTLGASGVVAGSYGAANKSVTVTVDSHGLASSVVEHDITPVAIGAQPSSSNLSSLAAEPSNTAFGRLFLSLVDAAGARSLIAALSIALKGSPGGVAELDGTGRVPSYQLPSYLDDVLEFANLASFPVSGDGGKIYVDLATSLTYRWSGSVYVLLSPTIALGELASTAYRGDRGKTAFDHSQITDGNPHGTDAVDVGAMPLLDLSGSPATFDFNDVNGGLSCIASVQWSGTDVNHHGPGSFGSGALYQTPDGYGGLLQMFVNRLTLGVHTRGRYQGTWSAWILGWSTANLTGFRGEHHHDSYITKAASYDFTGVTASLIKHATSDILATLSGGVPGRKYTLICPDTLGIIVPAGVTLYATAGVYSGRTIFSVGGMRPVMIQCMSATEWLVPNYGE